MLLRGLWVVLFAISLLLVWNIGPDTYLFYLAEALPFAPKFILALIAAAPILLVWFVFSKQTGHSLGAARKWIFAAAILLLLIKAVAAANIIHSPFIRQFLKSPVMASLHSMAVEGKVNARHGLEETPDDTFYGYVRHAKALPPQVIMMLVESWGEKPDTLAAMAREVSAQGFQVIKQGFSTYRGSTLSGEFRELCSFYVQPSNSLINEMKKLKCAPQYMKAQGYEVLGVHGYAKSFYARNAFWHRFGVDKQVFADGLTSLPQCPGPFSGVCDEDLIGYGIGELDTAKGPAFLYMLTLSSHEPVEPASLGTHGRYFNDIPVAHRTQVITRRAISSLLDHLQKRKNHGCTLVYMAGDHQPPSASAKGGIFETGKVPYMVFSTGCEEKPAP